MIYEYAFSCMEEGDDEPFRLFQPVSKKVLPCSSTQAISDAATEDVLVVDRTEGADLIDPLNFLPVSLEVVVDELTGMYD